MGNESGQGSSKHIQGPVDYESLPPESRTALWVRVCPTADGGWLSIPCLVITGRKSYPRLACVAGVHGNEHEGITALLELWEELDPHSLHGTLVMVPSTNPPAFRASARRNPEDMVDMNRIFPGSPDGNTTEQLAHHLVNDILVGSDLVLSMHGWTDDSMVVPYTEYPRDSPTTGPAREAALAFGLEYVEAYDWPYGLLGAALGRVGIPAIEPEIGGLGCTVPERRAMYKRGVLNLLRHTGILQGSAEVPSWVRHVQRANLVAAVGGVIRRHVELGDAVKEGDSIATITNLVGEPLALITSTIDGFVSQQRLRASVSPGDLVAVIFRSEGEGGRGGSGDE